MALSEETKSLLTTIAENVPKVKQQGYDEGYEAGKQAFWDRYLKLNQNGYLSNTSYMFAGPRWNDETMYPDRNIVLVGTNQRVFLGNGCTNLRQRIKDLDITIGGLNDTAVLANMDYFFNSMQTTELPDLVHCKPTSMVNCYNSSRNLKWVPHYDTSKCTNMGTAFNNCSSLERIDGIDFSSATGLANAFAGCIALTKIVVYGQINVSISFSSSPLSVESMKSIISALKNYTGTDSEGTYTLTLKDDCKTALQADTETVELDGVSYTYFELITAKGWNLA